MSSNPRGNVWNKFHRNIHATSKITLTLAWTGHSWFSKWLVFKRTRLKVRIIKVQPVRYMWYFQKPFNIWKLKSNNYGIIPWQMSPLLFPLASTSGSTYLPHRFKGKRFISISTLRILLLDVCEAAIFATVFEAFRELDILFLGYRDSDRKPFKSSKKHINFFWIAFWSGR